MRLELFPARKVMGTIWLAGGTPGKAEPDLLSYSIQGLGANRGTDYISIPSPAEPYLLSSPVPNWSPTISSFHL